MSAELVLPEIDQAIMAAAAEIIAKGECQERPARDLINQPMINNWVEAMGDNNPRYLAGEAPPAMAQVWTMRGLNPKPDPTDPLHGMMEVLTNQGFTAVLGTNCEQTYHRYLKVGEQVICRAALESVVGPKKTGMGVGYFVTSKNNWYVGDELVATMLFRVLKFIPAKKAAAADKFVLYPTKNLDTEFFWEGTQQGELRIQKCGNCAELRHPPGPTCPNCQHFEREFVVSKGTGTVYSYVVHHHPPIPGHKLPLRVALVDLDEGVRFLAGFAEGEAAEIGERVRVDFRKIDDTLTLPVWRREEN